MVAGLINNTEPEYMRDDLQEIQPPAVNVAAAAVASYYYLFK